MWFLSGRGGGVTTGDMQVSPLSQIDWDIKFICKFIDSLAVEYPIIGAVGGLISMFLALLTAHAKTCAPPPEDRGYPRDGATATPLIK